MIVLSVELEGCYGPQDVIVNTMRQLLETRNESQPVSAKTGGSTFKNPPEQNAWRLIDQAGCRGMRLGEAMISSLHSNFMINTAMPGRWDLEALGGKGTPDGPGPLRRSPGMGNSPSRPFRQESSGCPCDIIWWRY